MNTKMVRTLCCFIAVLMLFPATNIFGQLKEKKQGAYYTGEYPNLFAEAGYAQKDIYAKLKKVYHDLFKGPNRIYFEVDDVDSELDFVHKLWNAKLEPYEDGYFDPYYDGLLYLFSLMHLSGNYQAILPGQQ